MKHLGFFVAIICIFAFTAGASAQTSICGNVSGLWDNAGSPYLISCDSTVLPGTTLTIEPGVTVLLYENVQLDVQGVISAVGNTDNHIIFDSVNADKYWNKILVRYAGAETSQFHYCDFKRGTDALHLINNKHNNATMKNEILNCQFKNCSNIAILAEAHGTFKSNHMAAPTAYSPYISPLIKNCIFDNTTNGIVLYIHGSRWQHTFGWWYTYGHATPEIYNNLFKNLSGTALDMVIGSYVNNNSNIIFVNNTVKNSNRAIYARDPYDSIIRNNIFFGNEIAIERTGSSNLTIEYNCINDNTDDFVGYPASYGDCIWQNRNGDQCDLQYNVCLDPVFAGDGYHLTKDSPCIDAGASEERPDTDIDGDSRPQGDYYDIGVDEYYGSQEPDEGACCLPDGGCSVGTEAECNAIPSAMYQGNGTTCPCPQGACCLPDQACEVYTEAQCIAMEGVYRGDHRTCDPYPCTCDCPDSDRDGVPDTWDACPETPLGWCVDQYGCSDNCSPVSVTCELRPDATDLSAGNVLNLNTLVRNNTNVEVKVFFSAEVSKRDNGVSVWTSAPAPVILGPKEELSKHFGHTIPPHFSNGYTYIGHLLNKHDEEVHRCEFDFNVVVRNNLWSIRLNNQDFTECDGASCAETWVMPWTSSPNDGSGVFQGECTNQFEWSQKYTKKAGLVDQVAWVITPNGNLTVEGNRNRQWHAWTWVHVETGKVLTIPSGAGSYSSCPRVFLNEQYVGTFPADLNLISGWNRIDITGYNQNDTFSFDLNSDLAGSVDAMSSQGPE